MPHQPFPLTLLADCREELGDLLEFDCSVVLYLRRLLQFLIVVILFELELPRTVGWPENVMFLLLLLLMQCVVCEVNCLETFLR